MSGAVLNSRLLMRLLTNGEEDIERVSVLKEDISSTACELDNVDFVHICYIQCDLVDCYILITKSCEQRWPIHSCSLYTVVQSQI